MAITAAYLHCSNDEVGKEENQSIIAPAKIPETTKRKESHPRTKEIPKKHPENSNPRNPPRHPLSPPHNNPPYPARLQTPADHPEADQSRKAQNKHHAERRPELAEGVLGVLEGHAEVRHHQAGGQEEDGEFRQE